MKQLTFLVKPASSLCGLRCRYCFYEDVAQCRETQSMGIMSHETAEHLLRAAAQAAESGDVIQITFQGGEPTLAGLDFFRDFVAMEGEMCIRDRPESGLYQRVSEERPCHPHAEDPLCAYLWHCPGVLCADGNQLLLCLDQGRKI